MKSPELHLTSVDVLRRSSEGWIATSAMVSAEMDEHVARCRECAALLQLHEALLMSPRPKDGNVEDCISEDDIYRLAVGIASSQGEEAIRHIAVCSRCGPLLRQAIYDLGPQDSKIGIGSPDELHQYLSSTPAWQKNMAERLAEERTVVAVKPRSDGIFLLGHRRRLLWTYAPVAAVLVVAAALTYAYRINQNRHSVERLLAMSYNARRLTELRIPGGEPVALFSPSLGASNSSIVPSQLLEVKLEAQKHLDENPGDSNWRQVMGQIALVERNGEEARRNFELAQALNPTLPRLRFDLASAYFEIGDANEDPIALAYATDLYGRYIDSYPTSNDKNLLAIAYYNLALSEERQTFNSVARKHYTLALSMETDPSWRKEIETRIVRLSQKTSGEGKGDSTSHKGRLPSVADFLSAEQESNDKSVNDYEIYLDAATRNWIAEKPRSPSLSMALQGLARIGLQHQDTWLSDLLSMPTSEGDGHLSHAVSADLKGDANLGLLEARRAFESYRQTKNVPGSLRAEAEQIYALQRLGRSVECAQRASLLQVNPRLDRYVWLKGYLLLELASCQAAAGDLLASTGPLRASLAVAKNAHLRLEQLRAEGFLAAQLSMLGQPREAWLVASAGLNECEHTTGTEMRTYQFLSTIQNSATAEGMLWTAAITADAAAQASLSVDNRQIKAYAQEELGTAEIAVHRLSDAQVAFSTAKQQLDALGDPAAAALYDADWTADRADLLEQAGHLPEALEKMRSVALEVESTDNHSLRQHYFDEYGHLLLGARQWDEARQQSLRATADAELEGRSLRGGLGKLTWERDNARGYRILVESLINKEDPAISLRAWEWFRSASYREAWLPEKKSTARIGLPPMPDLPAIPENELLLVYARLDRGYAAWSIARNGTHQVRFAWISMPPDRLAVLAETHATLARDVSSPVGLISTVAADIFNALMLPFADQIERAKTLRIDMDPSLQSISVGALKDSKHGWLAAEHAILVLPPWWSRHPLADQQSVRLERALVVVGNPQIGTDGRTRVPQQYAEPFEVARMFKDVHVLRYPGAKTSSLFSLLPRAQVFHYSGHAIERDGKTGLLLTTQDRLLTADAFSAGSLRDCLVAVLAGCTTIGRSAYRVEDPRSLVNAILLAGGRSVIGTQWDVDSRASHKLMLRFYDELLGGAVPAEALRQGQNDLLSSPSTSHPCFWAAYQAYSK